MNEKYQKLRKKIDSEIKKGIVLKKSSDKLIDFFQADTHVGDIITVTQYSYLTVGVLTNITDNAFEISCYRDFNRIIDFHNKHSNGYIYYPPPQVLPKTDYANAILDIERHNSSKRIPNRKTAVIINLTKLTGCKYMPKIQTQNEVIEDRV